MLLKKGKRIYFYLNKINFCFCEKIKKEEIILYIMQDKYSVKPDKEFRINHSTLEKKCEDSQNEKYKPNKVIFYGKYFN